MLRSTRIDEPAIQLAVILNIGKWLVRDDRGLRSRPRRALSQSGVTNSHFRVPGVACIPRSPLIAVRVTLTALSLDVADRLNHNVTVRDDASAEPTRCAVRSRSKRLSSSPRSSGQVRDDFNAWNCVCSDSKR